MDKKFTDIDLMNQEHFSEIEKHLARQDECYKNIMVNLEDMKGKLDCMDNRFASKYVEKILVGMVAMILAAFMAGVIGFVFAPKAMASMTYNILLERIL